MKTLNDLKEMWEGLKENNDSSVEYSDLPLGDGCTSPRDTSSIWSWAVPMSEYGNRPRYLLIGDGNPNDWEIIDVLEGIDYSSWPYNLCLEEDEEEEQE